MSDFVSVNPNFVQAIRESFAKQGLMGHIGAELGAVRPGYVEIELPYSDAFLSSTAFSMVVWRRLLPTRQAAMQLSV